MNKQSKETYKFQIPSRFEIITFRMTTEVMNLLSGTTENKRGDKISNITLFYDLLSRMVVNAKVSDDFRRPLALPGTGAVFGASPRGAMADEPDPIAQSP